MITTTLFDAQERVRLIRRSLVASKNFGELPQMTVDLINQALSDARALQALLTPDPTHKPSIIGRDRALVDKLTEHLHSGIKGQHPATPASEDYRGSHFEVRIIGADGEATGHVARVTVELDRVEST